jgi:hypothetical protein
MRSKRFAHSVALGPSKNQAGTNLRSAHAVAMSNLISGGNQVQYPSTGFTYYGPGVKRTATIGNGGRTPPPPRRDFVKLGSRKHQKWQRVQRNNKRIKKTARKVPQNSLESCKMCLFQIVGQLPASGSNFR